METANKDRFTKTEKKKYATLKDVAKLAGVGTGSVSRYLNGDASIKDVNRQKIEQAIKDLKFVPNYTARKLACGSSRNILLLIVTETPILMGSWIYEKTIIQEIYDSLQPSGYTLQLALVSKNDSDYLYNTIKMNIHTKSVDAVMILSNWPIRTKSIDLLINSDIPYILIGCKNYKQHSNEVLIDNYKAFRDILELLISKGHRDIALLTGNKEHEHMIDRLRSFFETMGTHGIKVKNEYVKYGEYSLVSGYNNAVELIKSSRNELPTAIVCANDEIAYGAIKALKEYHIKIPEEVSVTGFDNLFTAEIVEPTLTTVQSPDGIGLLATKKLLEMLKNGTVQTESSTFTCELVERESVKNRF